MEVFNESLPIVVLITSRGCPHCTSFRGADGIPKQNNEKFNVSFVRNLLMRAGRNRINFFVEIFVESNSSRSQILEVNFYSLINETNLNTLINSRAVLTDENINLGSGNNVLRLSFKKIGIKAMINSHEVFIDSPTLTQYYMNKYIWNNLPPNIKELRRIFSERLPLSQELVSRLEDNFVKAQVYNSTQHEKFYDDSRALDNMLLTYGDNTFSFSSIISRFVPLQIRDYEISYPSWIMISAKWWNRGLSDSSLSIFARKAGGNTYEENGRFKVRQIAVRSISKFLTDYDEGKIKLDGPETLRNYFH